MTGGADVHGSAPRNAQQCGGSALTDGFATPVELDVPVIAVARASLANVGISGALRALEDSGALDLPRPGAGATWLRFRRLAEISGVDLSLGRLAEGHTDALAILAEAGLEPAADRLYGVWAASGDVAFGDAHICGCREYCSGSGIIDRALVTASAAAGEPVLVELDLGHPGIVHDSDTWPAAGMAGSRSYTVQFNDAPVARRVGPPGFYARRPGFWRGSLNVPACWYGGALALARASIERASSAPDAYQQYDAGAIRVAIVAMRSVLSAAADETDRESREGGSRPGSAHDRALVVRHFTYEGCIRVLEHAARLGGTGAACHDAAQSRRVADLPIYLRQHHPGPDLATIAFRPDGVHE